VVGARFCRKTIRNFVGGLYATAYGERFIRESVYPKGYKMGLYRVGYTRTDAKGCTLQLGATVLCRTVIG